ncbi:hypothetical protein So717_20030 [Roseobacter cerasinus]|uniref:Uncharacterized protein n=1 Tax=Roseobacter cerasinus TaxID=2602289 RepID=A0A640VS49_9RHOB|nr:hypothetical protein So717_20030 [Roseobacter cerasinus]
MLSQRSAARVKAPRRASEIGVVKSSVIISGLMVCCTPTEGRDIHDMGAELRTGNDPIHKWRIPAEIRRAWRQVSA